MRTPLLIFQNEVTLCEAIKDQKSMKVKHVTPSKHCNIINRKKYTWAKGFFVDNYYGCRVFSNQEVNPTVPKLIYIMMYRTLKHTCCFCL